MAAKLPWIERGSMGRSLAYLDINMGCPAEDRVEGQRLGAHEGSGAGRLHRARGARSGGRPVTVKFRRGWAEGVKTAPEFARRMEDAGACRTVRHRPCTGAMPSSCTAGAPSGALSRG